jgi:uncharacterized protein
LPVLKLSFAESAQEIDTATWERLAPPDDPFLNPHFLAILEKHGAAGRQFGWQPRHVQARDGAGQVVGLLPLYVRANSFGDFIPDWYWPAAYRKLGRNYFPKLLTGIPHTPATGPRLLVAPGVGATAAEVASALIEAAKGLAAEHGYSSWHVAFPAANEVPVLQAAGLLLGHNVQFHWRDQGYGDFAGYLASFAAEKRRKVRAERRRVQDSGLQVEVRHGDEINAREWPLLRRLYATTFEKFGSDAAFSTACWHDLASALGKRLVVFLARQDGDPVALSLCFRSADTLYGRYWGCRGDYPSLHFELCFYQGIAYCLREGLRRFEPGAGGEHKVARGFTPTAVHSLHWIVDSRMRKLIAAHLASQATGFAEYRAAAAEHLPFRQAQP